MLKFNDTIAAGRRAEAEVVRVLNKYTNHVYSNVKVETLYTKSGVTEIDVLCAVAGVLLVIEVKNARQIDGVLTDNYWSVHGYDTGVKYSTLNIFTQNRIHVRALKEFWFHHYGVFPVVLSCVVVPNGCDVPDELRDGGILTLQEFQRNIAELASAPCKKTYEYALDFVTTRNQGYLVREDFVTPK